ncbi:MAG: hypothetical protein GY906_26975 [bacterium]|nr:hypothetical protein [bacterium]
MKFRAAFLITAVVGVLVTGSVSVFGGDHTFVGAAKCKMCHKVQHTSWLQTKHAKATEVAKASADKTFGAECLQCHATNNDESLAGVQCETCHGAGSDYKKMSIMKDREQSIGAGLEIPTQATCERCHDGEDHHTAVVKEDQVNNKEAIHEFKKP